MNITGPQGEKGEQGVSVTHEWDGTVLKVTSASGTSSMDLRGEKGDKGDTGETGPQGETGLTGAPGVSATHKWEGTVLTVTSASGTSSADLKGEKGDTGERGPQGERGSDGAGLAILGSYASAEELNAAHPTGVPGDGYLIEGYLWVWSATENRWINVGLIQGPKGETGETGATGADGQDGTDGKDGTSVTHSWDGTKLTLTSASGTTTTDLKGETGETGATGEKGETGEAGKDGVSVTHSWNGTVLTLNSASGTSSVDLKGEKGETGETGAQGIQGETGEAGKDGSDGYSPVVTVTEVDDGHTVSIEDAKGTQTFTVKDGRSGMTVGTSTLTVNAWVGTEAPYTQVITIGGLSENTNGFIDVAHEATADQREAARAALLAVTAQADGNLTVTADGELPDVDIPVYVILIG